MSRESPIRANDKWFIGEDKKIEFTIDDGADPPGVFDITNMALEFILRKSASSSTVIFNKTTPTGIVLTDPTGGICEVIIDDTDTDSLSADEYYYTLARTDSGNEQVFAFGRAVLRLSAYR